MSDTSTSHRNGVSERATLDVPFDRLPDEKELAATKRAEVANAFQKNYLNGHWQMNPALGQRRLVQQLPRFDALGLTGN